MKSICFNLFDAHSVLFPLDKHLFGGAEVRGVTIANELAKQNIITTVVIKEHNKAVDTIVNGIKVLSHSYFSSVGMGIMKKLNLNYNYYFNNEQKIAKDLYFQYYPYIKSNAEYYAAFEISNTTKIVVDFCKKFNKRFILFIASDGELSFSNEKAKLMNVNFELAKYIIENSHKIFVQNEYQFNKLNDYFNIKGIQLNNPMPLNIEKENIIDSKKKYITWVGKSNETKQPLRFIELAKKFPNEIFYMVMNKNDANLFDEIISLLPSNIIFKESLSFSEINMILNNSKVFINTSLYEGFPNTFLQAGYFSVPIISLNVNPNNFLEVSNGGICCSGDENELVYSLNKIITDDKISDYLSKNINSYVLDNHSAHAIITKILNRVNESVLK
ncbi:MAG: glycosyltransferase [Bacteroidia bacterium]